MAVHPAHLPPSPAAGEINTLRGNVNWMKSRQGIMKCQNLGLVQERTLQKVRRRQAAGQQGSRVATGQSELHGGLPGLVCCCALLQGAALSSARCEPGS